MFHQDNLYHFCSVVSNRSQCFHCDDELKDFMSSRHGLPEKFKCIHFLKLKSRQYTGIHFLRSYYNPSKISIAGSDVPRRI